MPPSLKDRQKINHELKTLGFGGLEDHGLYRQIATLYTTHDAFRGLLMSTAQDQRRVAYEALRPHLCFTAKPLDVYEHEIKEKAEREQWDVWNNTAYPDKFKVGEVESEEYKLAKVAQEAIEATEWEKAKGSLEMVCTHCTGSAFFLGQKRKEAVKRAHDAGWRWIDRNGTQKAYCPAHVPTRVTMGLLCSQCAVHAGIRAFDEQDGYAKARLLGWQFDDEKCHCPKCGAKAVLIQ